MSVIEYGNTSGAGAATAELSSRHSADYEETLNEIVEESRERLGLVRRFVTVNNGLFLVFLGTLAMPTVLDDPHAFAAALVACIIEAVALLGCAFSRQRATRDSLVDVTSVIFVLLIAWQLATAVFNALPANMFPAPGTVFNQIAEDYVKILQGIGSSLGIVAEGFIAGTVVALIIGLTLGFGARSSRSTEKVVSFLSAIPPIVYIPYGIALLPTFRASSVMVIFLATLWPVLTGTLAGVSSVDKRILDSARVLNVGRVKTLFRVVLPSALPLIFNGLNIALCLSFILLTSAEMIGGSTGMGYYVKYYSDFGDFTRVLAGIIVIGTVITILSTLLNKLQKHLLRWR